ncbi:serine/threonine-protein phosphatase 7 long form homolog [Primulina eburnea]|uniref:serine/threonine-protein phosphatase 7 long form homolog n=1 Tax=Primulina eburnea TaxID=1245227 RepID=UPI003C6CB2CE
MSVLDQYCRSILINDNSTHVEVERYTRCVTLMIIGGCMLPDSDGCSVNLMYLRLLRDTNQVSKYNWGSAVLAFLYRELCTVSTIGKGEIAGPIFILQVWALSRITFLCPDPFGDIPDDDDHNDQILLFPPFGERWNRSFTWTHTTNHSVRVIRGLLDKIEPNQFKWVLYSNEFDKEYWCSVCPLICFNIVEMYRLARVLRQFDQLQHIPRPAFDGDEFHECTRQGRRNYNWAEHHKNNICAWNDRLNLIVEGEPTNGNVGMTRQYAMWYDNITRRFTTPIDPQAEYGYRPGDATVRCVMMNEADVLRNWFRGLSLQEQPREALESAITETIKIGSHIRGSWFPNSE